MFNKPWILESKKCPSLVEILKYWTEGVNMCTRKDEKYRVTHKGWDLRDDCTDYILCVSLHSWFPATTNLFLYLPNHQGKKT